MTRKPTFRVNKFAAGAVAIALAVGGVASGVALSANAAVSNLMFVGTPGTWQFNAPIPHVAIMFEGLTANEGFSAEFFVDEAGGAVDFVPLGAPVLGQADVNGLATVNFPTGLPTIEHNDTIRVSIVPDTSAPDQVDYQVFANVNMQGEPPRNDFGFARTPVTTADLLDGEDFVVLDLPISHTGEATVTITDASNNVLYAPPAFSATTNEFGDLTIPIVATRDGVSEPLITTDRINVSWDAQTPGIPVFNTTLTVDGSFILESSDVDTGVSQAIVRTTKTGYSLVGDLGALSLASEGMDYVFYGRTPGAPFDLEVSVWNEGDEFPNSSVTQSQIADDRGVVTFENVQVFRAPGENIQVGDDVRVSLNGSNISLRGDGLVVDGTQVFTGQLFYLNAAIPGENTFGNFVAPDPNTSDLATGADFEFWNLNANQNFGYQVVTSENTPVTLDDAGAYIEATANASGRAVVNVQATLGGQELVPGNYYGIIYYDLVNGTEHLIGAWQVEEDVQNPTPTIQGAFVGIAGSEPTAEEFLAGVTYEVTGLVASTGYRLQAVGSMSANPQPNFDNATPFTSNADGEHLTSITLGLGVVTPTDPLEPGTYWSVYLFDESGNPTLLSTGRIPGGDDSGNGGGNTVEPVASFVNGNPTGEELVDGVDVLIEGLSPAESYTVEFFATLPDSDERSLLSTTVVNVGDVNADGEYLLEIAAYLEEGGERLALPDGTLLELVLTDELDVQLTVLAYTLGDTEENPIAGGNENGELAATGSDDISVQNTLFALIGGSFLIASVLGAVVFLRRKKALEPIRVQE